MIDELLRIVGPRLFLLLAARLVAQMPAGDRQTAGDVVGVRERTGKEGAPAISDSCVSSVSCVRRASVSERESDGEIRESETGGQAAVFGCRGEVGNGGCPVGGPAASVAEDST